MKTSLPHDSSRTHVMGQSEFIDDRPYFTNEVHLDLVLSPYAKAEITKIDSSQALKIPGVIAVYTAQDFHHNYWGTIFKDQQLLADKETFYAGEPVAIIVANDRDTALLAKKMVQVTYKKQQPINTIREAIQKKSFIGPSRKIERGNVEQALSQSSHRMKGTLVIRGADHFYLESQVSLAIPKDNSNMEVHSSSQHPTETQHVVAHALGIPYHQVTCIVKRMGGAFGGKESQAAPFAAYAALVAKKLNRPARIVLSKDDDMIITGKRNPFENDYEVGFDNEGRILALEAKLYSDGGAYADLSTSIMERAMLHIDNAYYIPNLRVEGQVCRTHFHPHTAFRGFGGPKGVATIEKIIEDIAAIVQKDPLEIRKINCYQHDGAQSITHYGQKFENNVLPELFQELEKTSRYYDRRKEILQKNKIAISENKELLHGLSLTAVKFGISFTTRFLNQANALVIVHRDGTIQISTGATEMGQGVNSRIAEMVAKEMGIDPSLVLVTATQTDKNGNTSPTAASSGTDLNGAAALLAVRKIKNRLSELATHLMNLPRERWANKTAGLGTEKEIEVSLFDPGEQDPNKNADWKTGVATYFNMDFRDGFVSHVKNPNQKISFSDLVVEAYHNRISLTDYAHYKFSGLSFDKLAGRGNAFLYFTQGVAASEVSVNRLTGEIKVLRSDILMDLGRPVNEDLDRGQITGGFVQGMGWMTTEKLHYSANGLLLTHSPSTYKIPNIQDTPREFRVDFFQNDRNYKNVRGTKASGEPPLLLSISVWTATLDALRAAGKDVSKIEIPATNEQVLRAFYPAEFS